MLLSLFRELGIEPLEDDLLPIPVVPDHNAPCHKKIDTLDTLLTCELNSTNPSEFDIGRGVFMLPFDDVDLEKRCLSLTNDRGNRKKTENDLDTNLKIIEDISKTVIVSLPSTIINNIQDVNVNQLLITGDVPENDLSDESWVPSDAPLHQTDSE